MRVVVNQLVALRQKTGIGHYTAQLLRCLREQGGEDRIDGFPPGWVGRNLVCTGPGSAAAGTATIAAGAPAMNFPVSITSVDTP